MSDTIEQTVEQTDRGHSSPPCAPDSPREFYSSKQLVETFSVKRNAEVFFKADSIKKATNDRSYVKPIIMRLDGERHDDIDFNFNLNVSTVEIIKRHPTREFWVISIDATSVKQFIDKEGLSHDFYPSETMYVMNAKTVNKLKELDRAKLTVSAFEGEL